MLLRAMPFHTHQSLQLTTMTKCHGGTLNFGEKLVFLLLLSMKKSCKSAENCSHLRLSLSSHSLSLHYYNKIVPGLVNNDKTRSLHSHIVTANTLSLIWKCQASTRLVYDRYIILHGCIYVLVILAG